MSELSLNVNFQGNDKLSSALEKTLRLGFGTKLNIEI